MNIRLISLFVLPLLTQPLLGLTERDSRGAEGGGSSFTVADVHGTFAAVGIYGPNIARALGTETFDGHGKVTGSAIVNQPGPNQTRAIRQIGLNGTYTVNADGTGKMFLTVTLPDGSTANVVEDYLITRTKLIHGAVMASEMTDAQEQPSAVIDDQSLVVHSYTLRQGPVDRDN